MVGTLNAVRGQTLAALSVLLLLMTAAPAAAELPRDSVFVERSYVDDSREIKSSNGFAGAKTRRIDTLVWYPQTGKGPWPLVIYSHGTFGSPDNAMHLVQALVSRGYVVAAPNYPLTSHTAFTRIKGPDITDVIEQTRDVSFVIDRLLADSDLGKLIDHTRIGTTGHSLGGVTSYFASFGRQTRDPRIVATAPIGAGDPVQSALTSDMGLAGTAVAEVSVPVLFLSAGKDVFARMTGQPEAAYARVRPPKYEVLIRGGVHVWFRDNDTVFRDNKNPDCVFFEEFMPGVPIPGCEERTALIEPARQKQIARAALTDFFDGYLKGDEAALQRLRELGKAYPEAELSFSD